MEHAAQPCCIGVLLRSQLRQRDGLSVDAGNLPVNEGIGGGLQRHILCVSGRQHSSTGGQQGKQTPTGESWLFRKAATRGTGR